MGLFGSPKPPGKYLIMMEINRGSLRKLEAG
jgi:hypothetical protein